MLGRGVDQILPHPGDPTLRESHVRDARTYVQLAEAVNGPIPSPVDYQWPWGEALKTLEAFTPDVRVINLETSVTRGDDFAPGKGVHYRMTPENLPSLTVCEPDACILANNHVMDFGYRGLADTLHTLSAAGVPAVGAGRDADDASRPIPVPVDGRRVLVFSVGTATSGIPPHWAATRSRPGVNFISQPSPDNADEVVSHMQAWMRTDDIVIASIHWGGNWGYETTRDEVQFAHRLVDAGVDVVHGHSSHHPRPVEVYRHKLILYGCGDFIDDYEGISGHEKYRDDLRLQYFASVDPATGDLVGLRMVPLQARQMKLHRASREDTTWLAQVLNRIGRDVGSHVAIDRNDMLSLRVG
jgi:poly-gamma-glutamate capsule biosynthesis protein CapA/YwtB (metallophosphatase superfamily)